MGKAIVYCGDCGKSLHEEDFEKGKAYTQESGPYCAACRPHPASPPVPRTTGRPGDPSARTDPSLASPGSKPPSTTRLPAPASTRLAAAPPSRGVPAGLVIGGVLAGVALLVILFVALSGNGRKPPPPPPPPRPSPESRPPPPSDPVRAKIEREMLAQRERGESARFDRFIEDIRVLMKDPSCALQRQSEIEGMLASAAKMAGVRQAEVEALRSELALKLREAAFEPLLVSIREKVQDTFALLDGRAEVERLLSEAEKAAGSRRAEVDALRAEIARKVGEACRSWSASIGFEAGFEKELVKIDDWKGLGYTEEPRNVHGGRRAVHIGPGAVGAAFVMKGLREGPTYVMSCWARKGAGGDENYVGFEFWDGRRSLTKHSFKIESNEYRKITHELRAPRGTKTLMFWVWSDGKGECFVDDVEVAVRPP